MSTQVSLIIPVYNESRTIGKLINTIQNQTYFPDEIIIVDGGSTDDTVSLIKELTTGDHRYRLIEAGRAMPGKGRNIGSSNAKNEWISYTDAGIELNNEWLQKLVEAKENLPEASIVYGNYSPQIKSLFDKCATITYVAPFVQDKIRGKTIVSILLKKEVWEKAGGFPDWRAAEDLVFMEKAELLGYRTTTAPGAMAKWELQPNLTSTYKKFMIYSAYNVWGGRQKYWHYGILKHYLFVSALIALGVFHHWLWFLGVPLWLLARVLKRIYQHRYQFGTNSLFNPAIIFMVAVISLTIDLATFSGWVKALISKPAS